jgi:hypothetical protein
LFVAQIFTTNHLGAGFARATQDFYQKGHQGHKEAVTIQFSDLCVTNVQNLCAVRGFLEH